MIQSSTDGQVDPPNEATVYKVLARLGMHFEIAVDHADILGLEKLPSRALADPLAQLIASAEQTGVLLRETGFDHVDEATAFIREGYPLVVATADRGFVLIDSFVGRKLNATMVDGQLSEKTISLSGLGHLLTADPRPRVFVAKKRFELDAISSSPYHGDDHHGEHLTPLKRFIGLLRLEVGDIWTVILFAFVAGILALATPLAVESLVNVVSWGTYVQPLVVLGLILLMCLGIAGVLRVLQMLLVELIQRRQFVRIVSDLAHRFPRANQDSLADAYPRELANRVFDIMTIQKATAVLLLDGVSIVLTTILGMVLLAFYHPFLLGFDIVLLISMISITWVLGRGGIRTAIDESIAKYRVVHWLQDVLGSPTVFKSGGGEMLAIQRANQLTSDYIIARKRQFHVVIRQSPFAISLQVIASTAVLALGGWLVIDGQLTLGQLVASELVVTVVVGAFAKAGKSLEKFYDLMAGVDKVGHLLDIPTDPAQEPGSLPDGPVQVRWSDLTFNRITSSSRIPAAKITAGARVAIVGDDIDGRSDLARALAGLCKPSAGVAQIGELDTAHAMTAHSRQVVGYAGDKAVFHGTLRENIDLGRTGVGANRVREVLSQAGLADTLLQLADGLQTMLQTDGYPLTSSQVAQLVIARSMAFRPRLLVIDGLLDELAPDVREKIWTTLAGQDAPWTLIVVTNHDSVADWCDSRLNVRRPTQSND